jgi:large subunit ribosomal protein L18
MVGELIAKKALDKGIKEVVFDRGGFVYHGRVQSLAEGAREAGLEF